MFKIISAKKYQQLLGDAARAERAEFFLGELCKDIQVLRNEYRELSDKYNALKAEWDRWTDRDEKGRFVKRETYEDLKKEFLRETNEQNSI